MNNINVFINCPYDEEYRKFMHIIIYIVTKFGHTPQLTGQISDSEDRMKKIIKHIKTCKLGIHDISLMEMDNNNKYARFNMPFELGIDYAHKEFNDNSKRLLILEKQKYLSKKVISDLGGIDIEAHYNKLENIVKIIRNFFVDIYDLKEIKHQAAILSEYQTTFELWFKKYLNSLGYPEDAYYSMDITITDFKNAVKRFFEENPDKLIKIN